MSASDGREHGELSAGLDHTELYVPDNDWLINALRNGLLAITTAGDGAPFAEEYRRAGGGYEGLQAIAQAALDAADTLKPHTDTRIAQEVADQGLLWLVNRVLHPFGYALGVVQVTETSRVAGVSLHRTDDFEGIIYGDGEEGMVGRRKLLHWLSRGMKR